MATRNDQQLSLRFQHDGIGLAYDDLGDRSGPAIVLIPGGAMSRETWARVAPRLSSDYRVLPIDMAGHGDSDRAPGNYSVPEQGDRIAAFCEQVAGGDAVVVGHSFGGVVAAYVAATRPDVVRAAVLEDPPMFLFHPDVWPTNMLSLFLSALRVAMIQASTAEDPVQSMRSWLLSLPATSGRGSYAEIIGPDGVDRCARGWAKCDPRLLDGIDDVATIDVGTWGGYDVASPIGCPVLVARADPQLMPAFRPQDEEQFGSVVPLARYVVAERSGHNIHEEQPDWFVEQVAAFLASV